jgi:Copper transport outer membrane protein, MctB
VFDLRYHVVSLAAVFLALVLGVLLGVGISETGRVDDVERDSYELRIGDLESRLEAATEQEVAGERQRKAAQTIIEEAYPVLMQDRLAGRRVVTVFVGSADPGNQIREGIERMLADGGAPGLFRFRELEVPVDAEAIESELDGRAELVRFSGAERYDELGAELAKELVAGEETPLWDALSPLIVGEEAGIGAVSPDAVVVARTAEPQEGPTAALLAGFYRGLASADVPAVGVEAVGSKPSAVPVYKRMGLSSVDAIDTDVGRLAGALVLSGAPDGNYGLKASAQDGILPRPVEPVGTATASG